MKFIWALVVVTLITACESKNKRTPVKDPDYKLYNDGIEFIKHKKYNTAIQKFVDLETEYPYSSFAKSAAVMEAYAHYLNKDYDMAIGVIENFVALHPSYHDIAYMYYLKLLCYYEQIVQVTHDQENTNNAKQAALELIAKFPESKYAKDAKYKIDLIEDHLAGKELEIGRYYLKKGDAVAAIRRFDKVIEEYPSTLHVQEALYRLTESYLLLGITEQAKKNAAVLGYNYPNSKWYKAAFDLMKKYNITN